MELKLYKAKVIDVEDSDKKGKIKIQVLPEMEGVDDGLLPWAVPFSTLCSEGNLSSNLPKKDSTIRVLIDTYWKRFYYLSNMYFDKVFNFDRVSSQLGKADVSDNYVDLAFTLYEDGGLEFHNKKDGSHGFVHKSDSYAVFDKDGALHVKSPNQEMSITNGKCTITFDKNGKMTIESPNQPITLSNQKSKLMLEKSGAITMESMGQTLNLSNSTDSLGSLLAELINDLSGLTTVGSPVNHTSPQLTAQMGTLLPKVKKLLK